MASEMQPGPIGGRSSRFQTVIPRPARQVPAPPTFEAENMTMIKIEPEHPSKRYYPGQVVRGRLCINVQEAIGVQYIRIAAIGGLRLRSASKREAQDLSYAHDLVILNSGVRVTRQAGWRKDLIAGRTKRDRWHMLYDRSTLPSKSGRYDDLEHEENDDDALETSSRNSRHDSKYASMSSYSSSVESLFILDVRQHDISFSIPIPRSNVIPPSYTTAQFQIQYNIVATLHYETMDSTAIHVMNDYHPLHLSSLTPISTPLYNTPLVAISRRAPVTAYSSKFKSLLTSTGWIEASAFIPRRAFLPGDGIPLGIRVINCSEFRPSRATVDVTLSRVILNSAGKGESRKRINGVVGVFEGIAGQDREVHLDMDSLLSIPSECISTIFADMTQNLLEVVYKVRIKTTLVGTIRASKPMMCFRSRKQSERCEHVGLIEFPIVIGTLPNCDLPVNDIKEA
ncbi:hypothetical protein Unana1_08563 [Umbelopsis nana]